ncbi:hypothetical protein DAEQUDRAFT_140896 [Daedalea quercina L-15889]|uniref:Uncharacterized protein n=1 Tax=Daedalea quercina L-15889 TaxID=1314783 RepID=A0A165RUJ1_9APHY|nr:hypothetical protein DAEQUDRAFT_140896 [Daedalea quercina L-15889]
MSTHICFRMLHRSLTRWTYCADILILNVGVGVLTFGMGCTAVTASSAVRLTSWHRDPSSSYNAPREIARTSCTSVVRLEAGAVRSVEVSVQLLTGCGDVASELALVDNVDSWCFHALHSLVLTRSHRSEGNRIQRGAPEPIRSVLLQYLQFHQDIDA